MTRFLRFTVRALTLTGAVALAACGGEDGGGGGGTTSTFTGVVSSIDGSVSGTILVTVQTASPAPPAPTGPALRDPVNATGTLTLGGPAISLTGTYDADLFENLDLTGGGYDFDGFYDGANRLEGTWAGPNGTSGNFVTTVAANAVAYCGTYGADDQSDSGTFSFVVAGGVLLGEAASDQGNGITALDGTVSGNTITIINPGGGGANGTISGNSVSGTFNDGQGGTGTWSGSVCP